MLQWDNTDEIMDGLPLKKEHSSFLLESCWQNLPEKAQITES